MTKTTDAVVAATEAFFADLRRGSASGGATQELSSYPPLVNLLNAVGATLKPKVFCISGLANQGAGHPDLGLYTANQIQRGQPRQGQAPERGVVEVKPPSDDTQRPEVREQVSRYWDRYGLVLVTNLREFSLVGPDGDGAETNLESFRLADSDEAFRERLEHPRVFAHDVGPRLGEYLRRVLSHGANLSEPRDLAWLLAAHAREGLARVEAADGASLATLRSALEEALGVRFEGTKGERFFYSSLVQTLFYGVFSAWVLWSREGPSSRDRFNWHTAVWHLRVPVLQALFQQLSNPSQLQALDLIEVLDWTAAALNRVDKTAFFARFDEGEAVPYFYEPFLAEFDPDLRKRLGVWYTPTEVVRYMVARVDKALKDDLGVTDGLADDNVYILDPSCGTGAYLAEVLRRIAMNLGDRGLGALVGPRVKDASMSRVFGFEIMPAPFVVAHLQIGLTMQALDAPLADDGHERAGVFLTNALTGWEPSESRPLPFQELQEERDLATGVKQNTPILVILGNPPYDGFAGVAVDEEHELLEAYRDARHTTVADTRGLNDPYVRFFRVAERRIVEATRQGIVCFISNNRWLDGLSFPGMRERYLDAFDIIRIDCLNGDKRKTGKTTPDGSPDPSIFSTAANPAGIQVGTAVTTLVRKQDHTASTEVHVRQLWGEAKRQELSQTAEAEPDVLYERLEPHVGFGFPFLPITVSDAWFEWPELPDLFSVSFPGIHTGRDRFLIDVDEDSLRARIAAYFDADQSHGTIAQRYPAAMRDSSAFKVRDATQVREALVSRGGPIESGFVRLTYRPFDNRWLYWESDRRLLTAPSPGCQQHAFPGNLWLSAARHLRRDAETPQVFPTTNAASFHLIERGAAMFPAWLQDDGLKGLGGEATRRPNLTKRADRYLRMIGASVEDLFHHVLATLHDPSYRRTNRGALQMAWPRIPLPDWANPSVARAAQARAAIRESVARGRQLAHLFDSEREIPTLTTGSLSSEAAVVAIPSTVTGRNMSDKDLFVTAGWGYSGANEAIMPGKGTAVERAYTRQECDAINAESIKILGGTTYDIYLNDSAHWRNVPQAVWNYRLGGYQVLKKWLSYRDHRVLGRALRADEVEYFSEVARRIAAIILITGSHETHGH